MFGLFQKRRISSLDKLMNLWPIDWKGHTKCFRCGREQDYGNERWADVVGAMPLCRKCWENLSDMQRLGWLTILLALWVQGKPEATTYYQPPHPQAYHRDWGIKFERWRRTLLEPESAVARKGGDAGNTHPSFGPDYIAYTGCYTANVPHELFPIPPLKLQICISCHGWFDVEGNACEPWAVEST